MNMAAHIGIPPKPPRADASMGIWNMAQLTLSLVALAALAYVAWTTHNRNEPPGLPIEQSTPGKEVAALAALSPDQRSAIMAEQQARLAADPLDREALFNLSLLQAAEGNAKASEQLALAAAARSLRDVRIQAAALEILLKRGDVAKALGVMDGLMRSRPQLQEKLSDQIMQLARTREGEPHVVALLASDPPWRIAFMQRAVNAGSEPEIIYRLFEALKHSEAPPADVELRLLLGRLVKEKRFSTANYIWLDFLDEIDLRKVDNVFDGGFDATSHNLYFDWTIARTRTTEVKIVPRATGSADKVLRVDYIGNREAITPAYQYLRLQPGTYVLSGEQRADALKSDSGIVWRVTCMDGPGSVIAAAPLLSGDAQWSRFDVRFAVPAGCQTQMLYLGSASSAVLDQQISGSAQFDGLAIQPLAVNP